MHLGLKVLCWEGVLVSGTLSQTPNAEVYEALPSARPSEVGAALVYEALPSARPLEVGASVRYAVSGTNASSGGLTPSPPPSAAVESSMVRT